MSMRVQHRGRGVFFEGVGFVVQGLEAKRSKTTCWELRLIVGHRAGASDHVFSFSGADIWDRR